MRQLSGIWKILPFIGILACSSDSDSDTQQHNDGQTVDENEAIDCTSDNYDSDTMLHIAGQTVGEYGDPISDVFVEVIDYDMWHGKIPNDSGYSTSLESVDGAFTFDVPPGHYVVHSQFGAGCYGGVEIEGTAGHACQLEVEASCGDDSG